MGTTIMASVKPRSLKMTCLREREGAGKAGEGSWVSVWTSFAARRLLDVCSLWDCRGDVRLFVGGVGVLFEDGIFGADDASRRHGWGRERVLAGEMNGWV